MIPSFRQLRAFLAVVESGSVSVAARQLGLTQPAASQQLRELERGLGMRLLERAKGRTVPNAAGQAMLAPARRAMAALEEVRHLAAGFRSGEAGRVRLGTGATACIHLLPPVLAALKAKVPGAEVIIATGNTPDMLRRVEEGDLDAALITQPAPLPRALLATPVSQDPFLALVPQALLPGGERLDPTAMARLPLILYESGSATRSLIDAWFRQAEVQAHPLMSLGSVEAIKMLVASGLGASILPALALGQPVEGAAILPLDPPLGRGLAFVLRQDKVMDRTLRALREALMTRGGLAEP
ncbi:LysR family transcriptional regulator [Acetobacteraceae bacterium H6797]|nr:LysR family transcriptional regulator [Acetobacteraceae bacterium H6797]